MSTYALEATKSYGQSYNGVFWQDSNPRAYLNKRIPEGINSTWGQLFKTVLITSRDSENEKVLTKDKVFLPSSYNLFRQEGVWPNSSPEYEDEKTFINFKEAANNILYLPGSEEGEKWLMRTSYAGGWYYYISEKGKVERGYDSVPYRMRFMLTI